MEETKNQEKTSNRKKGVKKMKNKSQGITLISLVITIIVLLILAVVSIAILTGDNGILTKAQKAKEQTEKATEEEQRQLARVEATTNLEETIYQGITIPAGMAPTRIEGESIVKEGLVAIDKNGNEWVWIEVPKPEEAENLIFANETGYYEEDEKICETLTEALKTYANSYNKPQEGRNVYLADEWYIDTGTGENYNIVTENTVGLTEEQKQLNNGCGLTLREYKENYQKMLKSVYKNGGFWIGRYEAGIEGSTGTDETSLALGRTDKSERIDISKSPKAISQKDAIPYNYVTCSEAQKLASQMSPNETRTSSLMFGIQWDLVCKYLEEKSDLDETDINKDSRRWGNYNSQIVEINSKNAKQVEFTNDIDNGIWESGKWSTIRGVKPSDKVILLSTGASNKTRKLNIYDFAGNDAEWTLGFTGYMRDPCLNRGGTFMADGVNWGWASLRWIWCGNGD